MNSHTIRGLWFAIAVLAAAGIATVAGFLSLRDGAGLATAFIVGAGAFGSALTLAILAMTFVQGSTPARRPDPGARKG